MERLLTEKEADKTKDVFVGYWKPPFHEVLKSIKLRPELFYSSTDQRPSGWLTDDGGFGGFFRRESEIREAWLCGDWDIALYKRIIED